MMYLQNIVKYLVLTDVNEQGGIKRGLKDCNARGLLGMAYRWKITVRNQKLRLTDSGV